MANSVDDEGEDAWAAVPRPKKLKAKENKENEAVATREDNVHPVLSCEQWKAELSENQYIVVFCTGKWCGPAREINAFVNTCSRCYTSLRFLKLEYQLEQLMDLFKELGIYGLPTFLFVCKGMIIEKIVGNFPRELDNKLRYYDHIASCLGT